MLRILFTTEDLASTCFVPEPAPVLETKLAAIGLHRGIGAPWGERWRDAMPGHHVWSNDSTVRPTPHGIGGAV